MQPKKKDSKDFEKVKIGIMIPGEIVDIQRDEHHKRTYQGQVSEADMIRFKFKLEGYKDAHYSRWMTFTYGEKSNLYLKYLLNLVAGAEPDMAFEIEELKGMKVNTLWNERNDFQFVESIFPADKKIGDKETKSSKKFPPEAMEEEVPPPDEEVPF